MYVRSVLIENLRCIAKANLGLRFPTGSAEDPSLLPNVSLLLGDNGSGKSTVLRAVALAVLAPILKDSGFVPYNLVRRGSRAAPSEARLTGDLVLHWQDLDEKKPSNDVTTAVRNVSIERIRDSERVRAEQGEALDVREMYDERSPAFFMVGYGATRRVDTLDGFGRSGGSLRKSRLVRYQRVAGLFEEHVVLTPLTAWLPQLKRTNKGRFSQVYRLLNDLLPDGCTFRGDLARDGEYLFEQGRSRVPFGALSDGYKAYIGWIADLLYHVCMGCPKGVKLTDNRGTVLVDEVDLHLHPEWQRQVVAQLAQCLPRLQFVLTTHSPIVAGTVEPVNILILERATGTKSQVRRPTERVHGLNADQVLVSPYFGLKTTRAPDTVDRLRVLSRRAGKGDSSAAVQFLRALSGEPSTLVTDAPVPTASLRQSKGPKRGARSSSRKAKRTRRKGSSK